MATSALISVSEYLRTSYEPDAEYVDGRIEERLMGEYDHGDLQGTLIALLRANENRPYFHAIPEWRVQVAPNRFRVPDIALRRASAPKERIATVAPLVCIEVLSPEDTLRRTFVRAEDFLAMGVAQVWIFDTDQRLVHVCHAQGRTEHTRGLLAIPGTPVTLEIEEVFSTLDEN